MAPPPMPAATALPTLKEVRDLLAVLLDRDVQVAAGSGVPEGSSTVEALYVDDRLRVRALAVTTLPFAARAGAAIGLMPPAAAEVAVQDQHLGELLVENVAEVFNVMAALVNRDGEPHLRLYTTYPPDLTAPSDVRALAGSTGCRVDLDITIPGYGRGDLGIVLPDVTSVSPQ